jgi:hypothetical protein
MDILGKFLGTLMSSRTQAHVFHLQTTSYASHKALQKYYEDIVELIDAYAEVAQGRFGTIRGYQMSSQIIEDDSVLKYFTGLQRFVDNVRPQLPSEGELNNTVDEISALISSTIYKLRFLS